MIRGLASIRSLFQRAPARPVEPEPILTYPMEPTDKNVQLALLDGMRCVSCGSSEQWLYGPCGGVMQNLLCGCCGQAINYCASVPQLSHANPMRDGIAVRSLWHEEGRTIRNRWVESPELVRPGHL